MSLGQFCLVFAPRLAASCILEVFYASHSETETPSETRTQTILLPYLANQIRALAQAANVQIDNILWSAPSTTTAYSVITVTSRGKATLCQIAHDHLDLPAFRSELDTQADTLVKALS
jgi:hypothetical protein